MESVLLASIPTLIRQRQQGRSAQRTTGLTWWAVGDRAALAALSASG